MKYKQIVLAAVVLLLVSGCVPSANELAIEELARDMQLNTAKIETITEIAIKMQELPSYRESLNSHSGSVDIDAQELRSLLLDLVDKYETL